MGYERKLIARIGELFDAMSKGFPASLAPKHEPGLVFGKDRKAYRQMSPNHWDMGVACELFRAAAYGTPKEYEAAKEIELHRLKLHATVGFQTSEQFTGRPHGGMYKDSLLAGRAGAFVKKDAELLCLEDELLRADFTYMAATVTPGGGVWCCGERMPGGPAAPQQSAIWREVHGLPHKGELLGTKNQSAAEVLLDDAWVSLRGLRVLLAAGDRIAEVVRDISPDTVTEMPLTARRVEVLRWRGGHLARYLDRIEGPKGMGTCDWVLCDHGQADSADGSRDDIYQGVRFGVNFEKAPLMDRVPPSGARRIIHGKLREPGERKPAA